MKATTIAAAAAALVMTLSSARAEEIVGRVRAVDDTGHAITLTNGRTYTLGAIPASPYFAGSDLDLHVGEKVRLFENGGVVTGVYAE